MKWRQSAARIALMFLLAALTVAIDYFSGPFIRFPIILAAVAIAATVYARPWVGYCLACVSPVVELGLAWHWQPMTDSPAWAHIADTAIRIAVLLTLVYLVAHLQAAQRQVRVLSGILPICSFCKRIRDQDGNWQQMEAYIATRSEAEFSHGLCPECAAREYGQYLGKKAGGAEN
jgi:hypothetical protein